MNFARGLAACAVTVTTAFNAKTGTSEAPDNESGMCDSSNLEASSQAHQKHHSSSGSLHCASELWDAHNSLGKAGASACVAEVVDVWVGGCRPAEREACDRRARDPNMFFACAQEVLLDNKTLEVGSTLSSSRLRLAFLFLRHAADLAAKQVWESPPFLEELMPCRQPAKFSDELPKIGNELLQVPVMPGRMCNDGACVKDRCGLVVLDNAIFSHEVEALISHGTTLWRRSEEENKASAAWRKTGEDVFQLCDSAMAGSRKGHFLLIYVLERLRRLISLAAGVPLSWVRLADTFLSRLATVQDTELSEGKYGSSVHCDESSFDFYHHSAVLWFTPQDRISGGEVQFWDADKKLWRRTVQPASGRLGLFSSGWENIHRVLPLTQQSQHARWSLPLFTSLRPPRYQPPLNVMLMTKTCIFPDSSEQWDYCENRLWHLFSAPDEDVV